MMHLLWRTPAPGFLLLLSLQLLRRHTRHQLPRGF
jgi:hypothetical protein